MSIPWTKIVKNPTAWIDEDCYPEGFEWADPSKIRIGKVYELFDHWRSRRESGFPPIKWNRSCEFMVGVDESAKQVHNPRLRGSKHTPESGSDEDFSGELAQIPASDSEAHPSLRTLGESTSGTESPSIQATPSDQLVSCESLNYSHSLNANICYT